VTQVGQREVLAGLLPTLRAYAIPLRTRFRGIMVRAGALLHGPSGWGEFSPFEEYGPAENSRWLASALESAMIGWPAPVRTTIRVNATVPAVGPRDAFKIAARSGCRTAKVKVAEPGQGERDDIERVAAVRDALGSAGRIRVDANGRWDVRQAASMLGRLGRYGLEYAEQPCATLSEMARLRRLVDMPLAADESIRKASDPMAVRAAEAADIVVLKVAPLGGVRRALQVAAECGLPVVVSSAVESSVGLAAGVALAAALPELDHDCGLGTMQLLTGDVTTMPLLPEAGVLPVRGVDVPAEQDPSWECDPAPWRERALAAAEFLG
jgi:o-succinylbenzoate synthase